MPDMQWVGGLAISALVCGVMLTLGAVFAVRGVIRFAKAPDPLSVAMTRRDQALHTEEQDWADAVKRGDWPPVYVLRVYETPQELAWDSARMLALGYTQQLAYDDWPREVQWRFELAFAPRVRV